MEKFVSVGGGPKFKSLSEVDQRLSHQSFYAGPFTAQDHGYKLDKGLRMTAIFHLDYKFNIHISWRSKATCVGLSHVLGHSFIEYWWFISLEPSLLPGESTVDDSPGILVYQTWVFALWLTYGGLGICQSVTVIPRWGSLVCMHKSCILGKNQHSWSRL